MSWISLRKPLGKSGRSGRSISREVSISFSAGPALALEEAAGDAAAGVGSLAVLDGEGKKSWPSMADLRGDDGGEHHGVAAADDDGAVGLLGDLAGLDGERRAVDLDLDRVWCHTLLSSVPDTAGHMVAAYETGPAEGPGSRRRDRSNRDPPITGESRAFR